MSEAASEHNSLLGQIEQIAQGLGDTFAPFCEVVLHDLTNTTQAILAIHNNLSGRQVGQPATELGLARVADPDFPQVISNYANQFADGRQVKSTSIGVKDSSGRYIAALCLNVDLTLFSSLQTVIAQFVAANASVSMTESLDPANADTLRKRIDQFAAKLATTPRSLKAEERRVLLQELKAEGYLEVRRSMEIIAAYLGVSRASVYNYAK